MNKFNSNKVQKTLIHIYSPVIGVINVCAHNSLPEF